MRRYAHLRLLSGLLSATAAATGKRRRRHHRPSLPRPSRKTVRRAKESGRIYGRPASQAILVLTGRSPNPSWSQPTNVPTRLSSGRRLTYVPTWDPSWSRRIDGRPASQAVRLLADFGTRRADLRQTSTNQPGHRLPRDFRRQRQR